MRLILAAMAGLISFSAFLYEEPGLLLTKMGAKLFMYGQVIVTWHLWCSGLSWKFLFIHCLGIRASFCTDTTSPNQKPTFSWCKHVCSYCASLQPTTRIGMSGLCGSYSEPSPHLKHLYPKSMLTTYPSLIPTSSISSNSSKVTVHQRRITGHQISLTSLFWLATSQCA